MGNALWKSLLKDNNGFTLAELIVAVAIMLILTMMGFNVYTNQTRRARDEKRMADLEQIRSALELFRLNDPQRVYPITTAGTPVNTWLNTQLNQYLSPFPADPWLTSSPSHDYFYVTNVVGTEYTLCAAIEDVRNANLGAGCGGFQCIDTINNSCNHSIIQP